MSEWVEFKVRDLAHEEREAHPDWYYMMDCEVPANCEKILVSDGKGTWIDFWFSDSDGCYLDSGFEFDIKRAAWMKLPVWRKNEKD